MACTRILCYNNFWIMTYLCCWTSSHVIPTEAEGEYFIRQLSTAISRCSLNLQNNDMQCWWDMTHDWERKMTHDWERNVTHDWERNMTHDSERNVTHDWERTMTHDWERNMTHVWERNMTHDWEWNMTHAWERNMMHEWEWNMTHAWERKNTFPARSSNMVIINRTLTAMHYINRVNLDSQ